MKTKAKSVKYFIIKFSPNGTLDIFAKRNDIDIPIQSSGDVKKNNSRVKMWNIVLNLYVQLICQMLEDKR